MTRRRDRDGIFGDDLGTTSALRAAVESARSINALYKSLGAMGALHEAVEATTRSATGALGSVGQMSTLHAAIEASTRSMSALYKGVGQMSALREAIEASTRSMSALYKGVGQMSALREAIEASTRSISVLRSLDASNNLHNARSGLSEFGAQVAAAGLIGNFDQGLTRAAVAAASLVESTADEPDALDEARAQSVLIDSIVDIETFARKSAGATQEEVTRWAETLIETLLSKYEERWSAAQSPQAKWSLDRLLNFFMALVAIVGLYYARQSLVVSEQSLQLAKQAADGSTQDMAALRSDAKAQVEELRRGRELLERNAECESSSGSEEAEYYIVQRHTRLLSNASTKSSKLADLYPNQSVVLIQRKHKWVKVQYYDYLLGEVVEGWVLKKYLDQVSD